MTTKKEVNSLTTKGGTEVRQGFRAALWIIHLGAVFLGFQVVRVFEAVMIRSSTTAAPADWIMAFGRGTISDLGMAVIVVAPLWLCMLVVGDRRIGMRMFRIPLGLLVGVSWFLFVFLLISQFYFFEEFRSNFNTVAVDYLFYPQEVFVNIWQSYPVALVAGASLFLAVVIAGGAEAFAWGVRIRFLRQCTRARLALLGGIALILSAFFLFIGNGQVAGDRTLNELAKNGVCSFWSAAWTRNLDYPAFYPTLPRPEALTRMHQMIAEPGADPVAAWEVTKRHVAGNSSRPPLNVVLFLEESLGSEFWGSLGRPQPTLTPHLDALTTGDALLFDNIYATGNRTVRGFEGVLSSFPPLPGDSIVKRDRSEHVETLARVLKRDGYGTVFLYGGRGIFDGMRKFAVDNGYDRFVEQKDFSHPTFTTAWGVCDEDLYGRTLSELRSMHATARPFFATILPVSNHRPYTYPAGRIAEDPKKQWRDHAVKYADWALGQFFESVKREPFYTNTIFVVVADHGARVYGSESIPIHSYEIPLLLIGPALGRHGERISTLGSQLDVAPTILALIGRPYDSMFYGRNLLKVPEGEGRAVVNHNRDIGMFRKGSMVVFGINKRVDFYHGNPKLGDLTVTTAPTSEDRELEKDATALFQTADEIYMNRRYFLGQ